MNEIYITKEMIDGEQSIPLECMPQRADSATTLLVYLKRDNKEGLLVLNYSPDIWKTWYPVFEPVNKFKMDYEFSSNNYKQLIEEYEQLFNKQEKTENIRKQDVINHFEKLYSVDRIVIDESFVIQPQYWLKYSKSQNKWTIYRFEFYIAKGIEPVLDLSRQVEMEQEIMPLGADYTNFKGLPLVENVIKILEDKVVVEALNINKITL